jgi:hypothetical protein
MNRSTCIRCFTPVPDGEYCPRHKYSLGAARVAVRRMIRQAKAEQVRRARLGQFADLFPRPDGLGSQPKEAYKD